MSYKTIYIVTSGEYSDYRIDAVFDTKDLAEAYVAAGAEQPYYKKHIEEYPLNKYVDLDYMYRVDYDPWQPEDHQWRIECPYDEELETDKLTHNHVTVSDPYFYLPSDRAKFYGAKTYTIWVKAKTRDAALKIANEKIMMAIAGGK